MALKEEARRNDVAERFQNTDKVATKRLDQLTNDVGRLIALRNEVQSAVNNNDPAFQQSDVDEIQASIDAIKQQVLDRANSL